MKKLLFALCILGISGTAMAQKIKKQSGDFKDLKNLGTINLVFIYDDMTVGKNLTEEEYIESKVADYNMKEAGKGDEWREKWINNRQDVYEPKFAELFNKYAKDINMKVKEGVEADVTLEVHTYYTEPGWNIGISRKPAHIHVRYRFVDNATGEVIAEFDQQKVPGSDVSGYDFDMSQRLGESYAKAGKSFAKFLDGKVK